MNPTEFAIAAFRRHHGRDPDWLAKAPGRVNLIGEHTDYNDGFVLPCAIDFHTVLAGSARDDGQVNVVALDYDEVDRFTAGVAIGKAGGWRDYVRGMVEILCRETIVTGADLVITGNVPQGAGLSSSASLEVAVATMIATLAGVDLDPATVARLAQRAENDFVGCACGIMDQMVSAAARAGHALLLDCRSLATRDVPIPDDWAVMILHSRVERGLVDSAYNARRSQCETAARHYGVVALRDLDEGNLERGRDTLDDISYRRARHVVSENARTLAAADALAGGDLETLGELMRASHRAMRDDFEITVPAIDALAAMVNAALGRAGGARMTGGGFGGCVVAVMQHDAVARIEAIVAERYRAPNGEAALVFICQPSAGATVYRGCGSRPSSPPSAR